MRFTTDTTPLARALQRVAAIISPQNILPALAGIALDADAAGTVRLTATDLTSAITATVPAEVAESGGLVLPADTLVALVARIPAATVRVDATPELATLAYGKSRSKLQGFAPSEMPRFLAPDPAAPSSSWTLEAGVLPALARQTVFATATTVARPILTGVQVTVANGQMTVVGTDGVRLSQAHAPVTDRAGTPTPFVVARRAFLEAARLADSDPIILTHVADRLRIDTVHGTVTTLLLQGQYPDVQRALPDPAAAPITFRVATDAFRAAVERINVVALRDRSPAISLRYQAGRIEIEALAEVGRAFEVLDVEADGPGVDDPMTLQFDPRLLLDALKSLDAGRIAVSLLAPDRPVRLAAAAPSRYFHVVLPLRPTS